MKLPEYLRPLLALALALPVFGALADHGLPTRDMNPVLQPVFLPAYTHPNTSDGWWVDHSFYLTNTSQLEERNGEQLTIDVENYRYELDLGYRDGDWVYLLKLPFVANSSGELDQLIDDWHEFWGFPEGNRDRIPDDQVTLEYVRNGRTVFSQTESGSGLADIAFSVGYHPQHSIGYYVGIELPTGDDSDFTGNDAVDFAAWIAGSTHLDEDMSISGMLGLAVPGDGGPLQDLLADQILVAQFGFDYRFSDRIVGVAQLDMHSESLDDSDTKAFGNSLQILIGIGIDDILEDRRLDLFFTEDIAVGTAPDITFGARLAQRF